jgi:hypothetical protein
MSNHFRFIFSSIFTRYVYSLTIKAHAFKLSLRARFDRVQSLVLTIERKHNRNDKQAKRFGVMLLLQSELKFNFVIDVLLFSCSLLD